MGIFVAKRVARAWRKRMLQYGNTLDRIYLAKVHHNFAFFHIMSDRRYEQRAKRVVARFAEDSICNTNLDRKTNRLVELILGI